MSRSSSSHSNRAHSRMPEKGTGPYAARNRRTIVSNASGIFAWGGSNAT